MKPLYKKSVFKHLCRWEERAIVEVSKALAGGAERDIANTIGWSFFAGFQAALEVFVSMRQDNVSAEQEYKIIARLIKQATLQGKKQRGKVSP